MAKKAPKTDETEAAPMRVAKVVELKAQRRVNFMTRLNERHAAVRMGSTVVILDEAPGQPPMFMKVESFHLWYANDRVKVEGKLVPVSRLWISSPNRRQYERVVFDPNDHNPNHYNLWKGFAVEPDGSKSCDKFLLHIRDNICGGDAELNAWVLGFFAHMVQKPHEKAGVSLVLRGSEGVGKGFLANMIGRLFPEHYVVVSQREHLVGRFNAHLTRALMVFVDEAFWAGDKQGEGTLKHLVTDPELLIEGKFKDGYMVKNLSRLIIASNENWVVPAGLKARRWAVLDVADTHERDRPYFVAINEEMGNGGLEAFMHLLRTFDLSKVDVYSVPTTAALLEQKEESMAPHERWWLQCLHEGQLRYEEGTGGDRFETEVAWWCGQIEKDILWLSYKYWVQSHNLRSRGRVPSCISGCSR